jgi:hypothetical protein
MTTSSECRSRPSPASAWRRPGPSAARRAWTLAAARAAGRGPDLDLGATGEARLSIRHDLLAGLQPAGDDGLVALRARGHDAACFHRRVGLHHEHEDALLARLQRLRGDDEGVGLHGQRERDVGELARPQSPFLVGEGRLEPDGAGRRVDRVVDERHRTPHGSRLAAGHRVHRQRGLGHVALDLGQLLLGNGERHVDRLHLIDDEQRRVVRAGRPDDVALVHAEAAGPAVHGRADRRVTELQAKALHRRLVGAHGLLGAADGRLVGIHGLLRAPHVGLVGAKGRGERLGVGLDLVVLLARDELLADQIGIPPLLHLGVGGLGLVAHQVRARLADARGVALEHGARLLHLHPVLGQVCLGLGERRLIGARVDAEQQVALAHVLALLDVGSQELAANLGLDRDHGVRLDRADRLDLDRHLLALHGGDRHRHHGTAGGRRLLLGLRIATGAGRRRRQRQQQQNLDVA